MEPLPQSHAFPGTSDAADDPRHPDSRAVAELTAGDLDALTELAQFEAEHRRILAMQALYQRRSRATGTDERRGRASL